MGRLACPIIRHPEDVPVRAPLVPFAVMEIALAVVFAWLLNSARRSVPVVILSHGTYNGMFGWSGLLDADPILRPMAILITGLVLIAIAGDE